MYLLIPGQGSSGRKQAPAWSGGHTVSGWLTHTHTHSHEDHWGMLMSQTCTVSGCGRKPDDLEKAPGRHGEIRKEHGQWPRPGSDYVFLINVILNEHWTQRRYSRNSCRMLISQRSVVLSTWRRHELPRCCVFTTFHSVRNHHFTPSTHVRWSPSSLHTMQTKQQVGT